jgi:excisionase family DNA binding protein
VTETAINPVRPLGKPWSLREAADFLGVSERTLGRMAEENKLRVTRIGTGRGRVLIPDAELKRVAEGR